MGRMGSKSWKTKDKESKDRLRKKNARKKQQKEWIFEAQFAENTGMRVGVIHNKTDQNPYDVIAIEIVNSSREVLQWEMRVDEAQVMIFGLSKVLTYMMLEMGNKGKFIHEFYEYGTFSKHKESD